MIGSFKESYSKLNKEQKIAVDCIDGPLLVIAGPGTGKTELLSLRVANILDKTDTQAENILCLTFTNFATKNMKDRLMQIIGLDSLKVNVMTFHSFASVVMQSYPDYFYSGARLSIAPESIQLDILSTVLDKLPLSNPLTAKFAGNYTNLSDIKNAIALSKDSGLSPEKLEAILKANLAYIEAVEPILVDLFSAKLSTRSLQKIENEIYKLPKLDIDNSLFPLRSLGSILTESLLESMSFDKNTNKTINTSKWRQKWLPNISSNRTLYFERKRIDWYSALADVYRSYTDELNSLGYYNYSDMIIEINKQLEQNDDLLYQVQEAYQYILIDEFQDTNAAQFRMTHLVAANNLPNTQPNIMAVGDDDQTIFAFNGAEMNNIESFNRVYQNKKIIVLNKNYRSSQTILDNAKKIIELSDTRVIDKIDGLDKNLISKVNQKQKSLKRLTFPNVELQHELLSKEIKYLLKANNTEKIAVLSRSHNSLVNFSKYLLSQGIDISYEKKNNVLDSDLIQQIYLIFSIISSIKDGNDREVNIDIAKLLAYPQWGIKDIELWKLAIKANRQSWLDEMIKVSGKLKVIGLWLIWLSKNISNEPIEVALEYILGLRTGSYMTSPLLKPYLKPKKISYEYINNLSALNILKYHLNEYSKTKKTKLTSIDFLNFIDSLSNLNVTITNDSWYSSSDNVVELMTVHKAKGLEFDTVYLIDAIEKEWRPNRPRRKAPANLPLQPYGENTNDYIRLAYVASTRAKYSFIVSGYNHSEIGEIISPANMFLTMPETIIDNISNEQQLSALETSFSWPELKKSSEKLLLKDKLDDFKLSPSAFNKFLNIENEGPRSFIEDYLLRIPTHIDPHLSYGTAIHKALQIAQYQMNEAKFNISGITNAFKECLNNLPISSIEKDRYTIKGEQTLKYLFNDLGFRPTKNAASEVNFNNVTINGALVAGKIDNLYIDKEQVLISDYKTGKPLNNFNSYAKNKALKIWQSKNQLLFYCLMLIGSNKHIRNTNIKTKLIYVEATNKSELLLEYIPTTIELERMKLLIKAIYSRIISYDIPNSSKYSKDINGIRQFEDDLINNSI